MRAKENNKANEIETLVLACKKQQIIKAIPSIWIQAVPMICVATRKYQ